MNKLFGKIFLSLLSAVICVTIFPKTGLWPLAWVGLVPLFFAISDTTPKYAFFLGWLYGAVFSIGIGYWVFHALYFNSSAGLIVSLLFVIVVLGGGIGFYFAIFSWGASRFINLTMPLPAKVLAISCLWTGMEFCRAHLFSGMPWAFLGHSQHPWLGIIQISDITGVYGISCLIVLTNTSIFLTMKTLSTKKHSTALLLLPILLTSATLIYGSIRLDQFSSPNLEAILDNQTNPANLGKSGYRFKSKIHCSYSDQCFSGG